MKRRARGASLAEIEAIYRKRVASLRRTAGAIVGDREASFDIVQDAFASAVTSRASFRGDSSIETWVARMVTNAAYSYVRRAPRVDLLQVVERANSESASTVDRVREAVSQLPERQRLVLFLRYYGDLDYDAIAEIVGVSSGTVGATLSAARRSLRSQLEEVLT